MPLNMLLWRRQQLRHCRLLAPARPCGDCRLLSQEMLALLHDMLHACNVVCPGKGCNRHTRMNGCLRMTWKATQRLEKTA